LCDAHHRKPATASLKGASIGGDGAAKQQQREKNMNIWHAMSGFDGRIARKEFWLAALVWLIAFTAVFFALLHWLSGGQWLGPGYHLTLQGMKATSVAVLIPYLLGLYPSLAMSILRLHDLNRSGWWCVPAYAPGFLYFVAPLVGLAGTPAVPSLLGDVLMWSANAVGLAYIIVLGCVPGTAGPNQYGDDPRAMTPAAVTQS